MIPGSANPLLLKSAAAAGGLQIERSLRFNSSDSAYCGRTFGTATSRKTWTWAGWVKKCNNSAQQSFFSAGNSGTNRSNLLFQGTGEIRFFNYPGSVDVDLITTPVFRDPSAWYHILIAVDTTQATSTNRFKLYVNGTQFSTFSTATYPSLNQDLVINSAIAHGIGRGEQVGEYFDGYLTNIHFIDGQALTPSSFTETDATTGQLIPKTYTGSYGTNGFNLLFADNSSNTASTLGKDTSGLSNNWTPNNLSVTAGAGNDSLVDSPTNYGTDTGVGGEVRGNYCTLNPLKTGNSNNTALTNGNLNYSMTVSNDFPYTTFSTLSFSSGKWYAEYTCTSTSALHIIGIADVNESHSSLYYIGGSSTSYSYYASGTKYNNNSSSAYGASWGTSGDVIGIALDLDNGTLTFYKNGATQGTAFSSIPTKHYCIAIGGGFGSISSNWTGALNFGQRAFAYPVSGFKGLNTQNLPTPLVTKSNTVMDVALYTGNGGTQNITGFAFSPDFVWIKRRSSAFSHALLDVIRGTNKVLYSNLTAAEDTYTDTLTAFNSDGFSLGADASWGGVNASSGTYVGWAWDAGTSTVSNPDGSITSQVRANATAGFSVIDFTCQTSGNGTVGHGLGVAPEFFIYKIRNSASAWTVYHKSIGNLKRLTLNTTDAQSADNSSFFNSTSPSSTLITLGSAFAGNGSSIVYAFAPVVGYNSFGSYVGNGSSDGPFCWTGFRPRFILQKRTDSTSSWQMWDTARNSYNETRNYLLANASDAEANNGGGSGSWQIDILSNGFKVRSDSVAAQINASGGTYVWAAFAESPFNYARAR